MERIITCSFADDFIRVLADHLMERFRGEGNDLSRIAVVFGGRRPALFLKRELGRRIGGSFHPPRFFSMDEFMQFLVEKREPCRLIREMDACYLIYRLAKAVSPAITKGHEEFSRFLPWAREIASFIDQCDLEDVTNAALKNIQRSAEIGYEVPASVNVLLSSITSLREAYHAALRERGSYSRGFIYLRAAEIVHETDLREFADTLFCNFFYLHATEEKTIAEMRTSGRATLFFQSDDSPWRVFERLSRSFSCRIAPRSGKAPSYTLHISAGIDTHAQVGLVRELVKKIENRERTVIVLPDPAGLIPLVSEIGSCVDELNISMGYPLKRNPLYSLLEAILDVQRTRREGAYYARDYLRALNHPLLKNMNLALEPSVTRVLTHKVEEVVSGAASAPIGGSLFLTLEDIENCGEIYRFASATLANMNIPLDPGELPGILNALHEIAFRIWEKVKTPRDLSAAIERFIDVVARKSSLPLYFVNVKVAEEVLAIAEDMRNASFADERFPQEGLFRIFMDALGHGKTAFSGSPLRGLQVLGLFETRALNFENVIVMDVNESSLPALRLSEPLIPRQVMVSLGLNRVEEEEEIQRYHFRRLISHAKNVYLIYDDSPEKERSRFIEELVWERQKRLKSARGAPVRRAGFATDIVPKKGAVEKRAGVMEFLKAASYSPSSVDTYLACPLSFYYRYVLRLREREDLLEEPDGADVGTLLHAVLRESFGDFIGKKPLIDREFRDSLLARLDTRFAESLGKRMGPESFLLHHVMRFRIGRFLDNEAERDVQQVISLEQDLEGDFEADGRTHRFKYRVDRIDRLSDGSILIVDYKTGGGDPRPRSSPLLAMQDFSRESIHEAVRSFQLPLYLHFVRQRCGEDQVRAACYNLRTLQLAEFPSRRDRERVGEIMEKCMSALAFILSEINDPNIPFMADEGDPRRCARCPYFYLCR